MNENQIKTIEAYDHSAENYDKSHAALSNYDETYSYIAGLVGNGALVIDLACGPANISRFLTGVKPLRIVGYDLSERMLVKARKNVPQGQFYKRAITDFVPEEPADLVVNGFGLPYLDRAGCGQSFECCYNALKPGGYLYLSFMEGDKEGFESPSFNPDVDIYIYYHRKAEIMEQLRVTGFEPVREWALDYTEPDGSVTIDNVIVVRKV